MGKETKRERRRVSVEGLYRDPNKSSTDLLESSVGSSGDPLHHSLDELRKNRSHGLTSVSKEMNDEVTQEETSRFGLTGSKETSDDAKG